MLYFNLALQFGLIWFLITLFTRQSDAQQAMRESMIVLGLYLIGNILFAIASIMIGFSSWWLLVPQIVLLYFLVDRICGTSQGITIRICAWFFGLNILIQLAFGLLSG